jgi:type I restriction enzyme S subunit
MNQEKMNSILVATPPKSEQLRIVNRFKEIEPVIHQFSNAQVKLDNLNTTVKEHLRKSILQEAIQGKLVLQDPTDEPAAVLLNHIRDEKHKLLKEGILKKKDVVDSVIFVGNDNKYYEKKGSKIVDISEELPFDIPDSWAWCRLGSVIILQSGQDLIPERYFAIPKGIPYITGASNLSNGAVLVNRWTNSPSSISHKGDLLITCKGTVGTMAYNTIGDIHIARQIMSIHSGWILIEYIEKYLEYSIPKLEKAAHSIIPGISRETIQSTLIPIPPIEEQGRIVDRIQELYKNLQN